MKDSKCPHNPKIHCAYLEQLDPIQYSCCDCDHYKQTIDKPETISGKELFLFLLIGGALLCLSLAAVGWIINHFRPLLP